MVDDEQDLCEIVRLSLESIGCTVLSANDGEAGLALIRARRPSLAILDIKMPKLNGYQVLTRMQQDPVLTGIPVIVMTSLTDGTPTTNEQWATKLGVLHFISKPMDPLEIVRVVKDQLALGIEERPETQS